MLNRTMVGFARRADTQPVRMLRRFRMAGLVKLHRDVYGPSGPLGTVNDDAHTALPTHAAQNMRLGVRPSGKMLRFA